MAFTSEDAHKRKLNWDGLVNKHEMIGIDVGLGTCAVMHLKLKDRRKPEGSPKPHAEDLYRICRHGFTVLKPDRSHKHMFKRVWSRANEYVDIVRSHSQRSMVAIEVPILPRAKDARFNPEVYQWSMQLYGVTCHNLYLMGYVVIPIHPLQVKKAAGNARMKKPEMVAAYKKLWKVNEVGWAGCPKLQTETIVDAFYIALAGLHCCLVIDNDDPYEYWQESAIYLPQRRRMTRVTELKNTLNDLPVGNYPRKEGS